MPKNAVCHAKKRLSSSSQEGPTLIDTAVNDTLLYTDNSYVPSCRAPAVLPFNEPRGLWYTPKACLEAHGI